LLRYARNDGVVLYRTPKFKLVRVYSEQRYNFILNLHQLVYPV